MQNPALVPVRRGQLTDRFGHDPASGTIEASREFVSRLEDARRQGHRNSREMVSLGHT
jgi:hypothetical protein